MSATGILQEDHIHAKRLECIITRCHEALDSGVTVPLDDMERITHIISEFLDAIHYSREEDSYFPCVGVSGSFADELRAFLIEHQFGRNVARKIAHHLKAWQEGTDSREPVSRYMRTYTIYLRDHLSKEDEFFEKAQKELDELEEREMYEYFMAASATAKDISEIIKEMEYLESCAWCR